jgi:hypothetical protein
MTKPQRFVLIITAGVVVALAAAGCVQTGSGSPNPTRTSSPSPTSSPPGGPDHSKPPANQDEAWIAANNTVKKFLAVQYEIEHDAGASPDRIEPYATGTALSGVQQVAAGLAEKGIVTDGAPKWSPNAAASSFGTLIPTGSPAIANGIVYLRGCYDVSNQTATYKNGSPAPVSSTRVFPVEFNVEYVLDAKAWMVSNSQSILGQAGAPVC